MKNPSPIKFVLGTALIAISCAVLALQSDASQPVDFMADDVSFNDNDGTTVYTGHVKMDQGSTHLTADKVVVYKDKQGNVNKTIATGHAHYTTLPDNQKNPMDALGDTIEYYPQKQIAIIIGNGQVIQGMNSIQGPRIIYDMVKQTVTSIPSLVSGGGKSLLILQPQDLPGR